MTSGFAQGVAQGHFSWGGAIWELVTLPGGLKDGLNALCNAV